MSAHNNRILIVGSESSVRKAPDLARAGYNIEIVASIEEAVKRQAADHYARVLIDPSALSNSRFELLTDTVDQQPAPSISIHETPRTSVAYLDRNFNFVWANRAYERECGCGRRELSGRGYFDLFPGSPLRADLERVRDKGIQVRATDELGEWMLAPLLDRFGRVYGIVLSATPEENQQTQLTISFNEAQPYDTAQDVIQRNEENTGDQLRAIFDHSPVGIVVIDSVENRAKWANPAYLKFLDEPFRSSGITGAHLRDFMPQADEIGLIDVLQTVASSGKPYIDPEYEYTGFKRGMIYWQISIVPLPVGEGSSPDLMIVAIETTEQVRSRRYIEELAEQAEQAESLLQSVIDSTPAHIYIKDSEGRFIIVNQALADLAGMEKEELKGLTSFDIFPASSAKQHETNDKLVLETGRLVEIEESISDENETRSFISLKFPLRDSDGEIYGVGGVSTDITERKRAEMEMSELNEQLATANEEFVTMNEELAAGNEELTTLNNELQSEMEERLLVEEELRQSEAQLREYAAVLEKQAHILDLAHVLIRDVNGSIIFWNSGAEAMYGFTKEEAVGKISHDLLQTVFPVSLKALEETLATVGHWQGELIHTCKNGTKIVVASHHVLHRDEQGNPAAILEVDNDITEIKKLQHELTDARAETERQRAELEAFLTSMADGAALLDAEGKILWMNDAARAILRVPENISSTEWLLQSIRYSIDGKLIEPEQWYTNLALCGETIRDYHYRLLTPLGDEIIVSVSTSPIRDTGGHIIGATYIVRDVRDRIEFEQRKQEVHEREHHIAEVLQQALIPPRSQYKIEGCKIAVKYQPALSEAEVGGDFYDIFDLGDDKLGLLIGDVAGKGLPAAIRVASARYAIRSYAYLNPSPARVLSLANQALCREQFDGVNLLTASFIVVDLKAETITYANGGHEPPILHRASGNIEELDLLSGALGFHGDFSYNEGCHSIYSGDTIVMVTDGITEARSSGLALFGREGIMEYLSCGDTAVPEEIATGLLAAATAHAEGRLQDDTAIIVFQLD